MGRPRFGEFKQYHIMIRPWPLIASREVGDFRIFRLRHDQKVSPRTGKEHGFYVLESADWVNVIALTPQRELVMVEQFRHGTNTVELEVPGGLMAKADATPMAAGLRELREETGYEGCSEKVLGQIAPNPAIMNNICHILYVEQCVKRHELDFDSGEDLVTRLVPEAEIPSLIAGGHIRHSIALVALYLFDMKQRGERL